MKSKILSFFIFCIFLSCTKDVTDPYSGNYQCQSDKYSSLPGSSTYIWTSIDTIKIEFIKDKMRLYDNYNSGLFAFNFELDIVDNQFQHSTGRENLFGRFNGDSLIYSKIYQGPGGNNYRISSDCNCKKI